MSPPERIDRECVEGYVHVVDPPRVLILRRGAARGSIWVPVSGKVEPEDANLLEALHRELREETGFDRVDRVVDLDWAVPFDGPDGGRWRLHAYSVELERVRSPRLSEEHVEAAWLPPEIARSRLHYEDNRQALDRVFARAPGAERSPSEPL